MRIQMIACTLVCLLAADAASARAISDKERMRQQAERLCYNDVQTLCGDEISDDASVAACMKAHRAQLSPACRKAFEAGMR